jgi:hypothetical protein
MKILEQAYNKINSIKKNQRDFFAILVQGRIGSVDKKTFRNLRRIYSGPQKARGRKKKFDDGKINFEDFKDSIVTKIDDEQIEYGLLKQRCTTTSLSL